MLPIFLLINSTLNAAHLKGGEITYTWISGNDYEIQLTLYRDCFGITLPTRAIVKTSSISCSVPAIFDTLFPTSSTPIQIVPICSSAVSSCDGGTTFNVQKWVYSKVVTLPSNCIDWEFTYSDCCRDASILMLPFGVSTGAQFSALLNNFDVAYNSSVRFMHNPVLLLSVGGIQTIINGASDIDGDSISVALIPPRNDSGNVITYLPGYSYLEPLSSYIPINIKPQTGDLGISPIQFELGIFVYEISEFRNGILVGRTIRDVEVRVSTIPNQLPIVSGVNGTNSYISNVCVGDTLRFTVYSSDPDSGDSTSLTWSSFGLPNSSLTTFGAANDSGLVELIADSNMVNASPYLFNITAMDNHCPHNGFQSFIFQLYVNGCSPDVWPGDANADLKCDQYDVLSIGMGYNASGPIRVGATSNWVAEASTNWSQNFNSGVNYKNSDCNGDGIIDQADTNAIFLNFGLTHPLRIINPNYTASTNFIRLVTSQDSAGPSDSFSVKIQLGSSQYPVNDIYGIAFDFNFNQALVDSALSSFAFLTSPLGTPGADLLTFTKIDWSAGKISAAVVRNDQVNSYSDTSIAVFEVVIIDTITTETYSVFSISGIREINANGLIQTHHSVDDSIEIKLRPVGIQSPTIGFTVVIYPNPANNELIVLADQNLFGTIEIFDIRGRKVLETNHSRINQSLNISSFANGVYWVNINTEKGTVRKQLHVSH